MSVLRKHVSADQQERGMDEILASIRRIIDEDPITPRHRAGVVEPSGAAGLPHVSRGTQPPAPTAAADDDVLAELLAPEAEPSPPRADEAPIVQTVAHAPAVGTREVAVIRDASGEVEIKSAVAVPPVAVPAVVVVAGVAIESAPLGHEILSADNVLAALARGLAEPAPVAAAAPAAEPIVQSAIAAPPSAGPPAAHRIETSTASAVVAPLNTPPEAAASPAEAVAAAVAAVAAVNAVAVQTGTRPREAVAPEAAPELSVTESPPALVPPLEVPTALSALAPSRTAGLPPPEVAASAASVPARAPQQPAAPPSTELVRQPPVSFEDAISGMLRPMLRDWLDDNMPRMVEKALKEEIAGSGGVIGHSARLARPDAA